MAARGMSMRQHFDFHTYTDLFCCGALLFGLVFEKEREIPLVLASLLAAFLCIASASNLRRLMHLHARNENKLAVHYLGHLLLFHPALLVVMLPTIMIAREEGQGFIYGGAGACTIIRSIVAAFTGYFCFEFLAATA